MVWRGDAWSEIEFSGPRLPSSRIGRASGCQILATVGEKAESKRMKAGMEKRFVSRCALCSLS